MSKQRVTGSIALAVIVAIVLVNSIITPDPIQAAQNDAPLSACGPSDQLGSDVGANVGSNARCFEIRMYTADPTRDGVGNFKGGINELHQRFREQEIELFTKHGAEIIGTWQDVERPNTLIWMLAYRDRAHREEVWAAFNADPAWEALRLKYFVPLVSPQIFMMSSTDYSPLK